MLRVFGFIVHCDHPHKLLISFIKVLDGDQELIQEAWNVANDRWEGVWRDQGGLMQGARAAHAGTVPARKRAAH